VRNVVNEYLGVQNGVYQRFGALEPQNGPQKSGQHHGVQDSRRSSASVQHRVGIVVEDGQRGGAGSSGCEVVVAGSWGHIDAITLRSDGAVLD
jgi:hypothetical protein